MRFAILLLIFLALVCIPSTFIPQGRAPSDYAGLYGDTGASLIIGLGMNHVFTSFPFYLVAGLFILNLAYCAIWRSIRGHHRLDVLHLGLLLFCVGAMISAVAGQESPILWMDVGDSLSLPDGGRFILEDFETVFYPDGRPRAWISRGTHFDAEGKEYPVEIAVNSPARLEGIKIYQNRHRTKPTLHLIPLPGFDPPDSLGEGEIYAGLRFVSVRSESPPDWTALFMDAENTFYEFEKGERLGDATIGGYETMDITGLRLVRDPGVPLVFASFVPIGLGFILILFKKRKTL
ncbi:MAG: cytochrome c biogenesis protein ResB [Spirochaetaceae bacterium]|nr:cytochrome c biogenesis protein ResB [Spirochaetaceae bacterium]